MNLPFFIAKRIHFGQETKKNISQPTITIATAGVTLSMVVIILSVGIITGFKSEISNKITGFGAHLNITHMDSKVGSDSHPISPDSAILSQLKNHVGVKHVQTFINKPGIVKVKDNLQGLLMKGVTQHYDWSFIEGHLLTGTTPKIQDSISSYEALISQHLASTMGLQVGDDFVSFFFQDKLRVRKFTVSGIYQTHFAEFDELFVFVNMRTLQELNRWTPQQVGGIELFLHDFSRLDEMSDSIYFSHIQTWHDSEIVLQLRTIKEMNPALFNWLEVIDINIWVILIIMISIACFNMGSGLLVIILEKINLIGLLKSMGSNNLTIRRIFLTQAGFIILKGMLWGNVLGYTLLFVQHHWHFIKLDPVSYYIAYVPIHFSWTHVLFINLGTLGLILGVMLLPSMAISRISPTKSIKFD